MNIEAIEILVVAAIVLLQLLVFFRTKRKIEVLHFAFPDVTALRFFRLYVPKSFFDANPSEKLVDAYQGFLQPLIVGDDDNGEIILRPVVLGEAEDSGEVFEAIRLDINRYLVRNVQGSPDLNVLKDITERHIDALEEEINLTITVPLYLGLMGTMLGIVIGLFSMSNVSSGLTVNAPSDTIGDGITLLLGGVKIAMVASLVGLFLTVVNSGWYFRLSKREVDTAKNRFYSFLQEELLPIVSENFGGTFDTLHRNLFRFNETFTASVDRLGGTLDKNIEGLKLQRELITSLENLDIGTVAQFNVKVLKEMRRNVGQVEKLNQHFENVNSFVENSKALTDRIIELLERTDNIRLIAANVDGKLTQSGELMKFLSQHFSDLEEHKKKTTESISEVRFEITDVFKSLEEHMKDRTKDVREFVVQERDLLKDALTGSRTSLSNLEFLGNLKNDVELMKDSTASQSERIRTSVQSLIESTLVTNALLARIAESTERGLVSTVRRYFGGAREE